MFGVLVSERVNSSLMSRSRIEHSQYDLISTKIDYTDIYYTGAQSLLYMKANIS